MERIPDEAIVVRGGRNRPEDIQRGAGTHPSGVTGISVECAVGLTIEALAATIPHGQLGSTTVDKVREAGGDVIRTKWKKSTSCNSHRLDISTNQRSLKPNSSKSSTTAAKLMKNPRIFADFHNADVQGRLRLNCIGTVEDLARQKVELQDGQVLMLYSEDLEVDGVVQYSAEECLWVAAINWDAIEELQDLVVQANA